MKSKKIVLFTVIFLLISGFFVDASNTRLQDNSYKTNSADILYLPTWYNGTFWKYNMDFEFKVDEGALLSFLVDAVITDMYATVIDIDYIDNEKVYVLSLYGEIVGDLSFSSLNINLIDFDGDFGGKAYISNKTLGIKRFEFTVDDDEFFGGAGLDFDMNMDFDPCFDFFSFPIDSSEEPWEVNINKASLYARAFIDHNIPFVDKEIEFNSSIDFNDTMMIKGAETSNGYESIIIGGDGTWGDPSELWYANDAGYLVKVIEGLSWEDGYIESNFNLNLLKTNYRAENKPPKRPDTPYGTDSGDVGEEYSYETKTTDSNDDDVYYQFDWGDGTQTDWLGPYDSGQMVSASHEWNNKGFYSVSVKARDENFLESVWSEALSVNIKGEPNIDVIIHRIEKIDEIDWDPLCISLEPEWFYEVSVEGSVSPPERNHNTDDGSYYGEWESSNNWNPEESHDFKVIEKNVTIQIKLMDYDSYGNDDLADISGCNHPDTDGKDDIEDDSELPRGAIYHGTYNVVTGDLKPNNEDYRENADFVYEEGIYYLTCGHYSPDNSIRYEDGIKDPENDALVYFRIENDYLKPRATAEVKSTNGKIRPKVQTQFTGRVLDGAPEYSWNWSFGDGSYSDDQNPLHIYDETGSYTVILTVTDGFGEKSISTIEIDVENSEPELTSDTVEWTGDGKEDDMFTFSVHYLDSDSDSPTVKNLILDGEEKMLIGSGSNSDYSICLRGSDIGKGEHTFRFYFEDGYGGFKETDDKEFTVKKTRSKHITENILQKIISLLNLDYLFELMQLLFNL